MEKLIVHIAYCSDNERALAVVDAVNELMLVDSGNWKIIVASPSKMDLPDNVGYIHIGNPIDRAWHRFMARRKNSDGFHSVRATSRLINKLVCLAPHLVHLHNLNGCYLHIPLLLDFLSRASIPVVMSLYDSWLVDAECNETHVKNSNIFNRFQNLYLVSTCDHLTALIEGSALSGHPLFTIPVTKNDEGVDVNDKNSIFVDKKVSSKQFTSKKEMAKSYIQLYENLL